MITTLPNRIVVLISAGGAIVTHFETDREEFPLIATHDRDRIFKLAYQGDLTKLRDMEMPHGIAVHGAMYQEVEAWRISGRTINKPRALRRRHKSAKIYQFPRGREMSGLNQVVHRSEDSSSPKLRIRTSAGVYGLVRKPALARCAPTRRGEPLPAYMPPPLKTEAAMDTHLLPAPS